ncbi:MAG: hypothetical protein REI78_11485 [Pedobacter sp.]|nr:hypothetical protein [Pedobacter sp.]MDQ8053644.1 hypothetical protein [Pedobacter sp.]
MNSPEEREKSMQAANETGHYKMLLVGVVIGIIGVYARFAIDAVWLSILSWVILTIGTVIACKAVFKMMNTK